MNYNDELHQRINLFIEESVYGKEVLVTPVQIISSESLELLIHKKAVVLVYEKVKSDELTRKYLHLVSGKGVHQHDEEEEEDQIKWKHKIYVSDRSLMWRNEQRIQIRNSPFGIEKYHSCSGYSPVLDLKNEWPDQSEYFYLVMIGDNEEDEQKDNSRLSLTQTLNSPLIHSSQLRAFGELNDLSPSMSYVESARKYEEEKQLHFSGVSMILKAFHLYQCLSFFPWRPGVVNLLSLQSSIDSLIKMIINENHDRVHWQTIPDSSNWLTADPSILFKTVLTMIKDHQPDSLINDLQWELEDVIHDIPSLSGKYEEKLIFNRNSSVKRVIMIIPYHRSRGTMQEPFLVFPSIVRHHQHHQEDGLITIPSFCLYVNSLMIKFEKAPSSSEPLYDENHVFYQYSPAKSSIRLINTFNVFSFLVSLFPDDVWNATHFHPWIQALIQTHRALPSMGFTSGSIHQLPPITVFPHELFHTWLGWCFSGVAETIQCLKIFSEPITQFVFYHSILCSFGNWILTGGGAGGESGDRGFSLSLLLDWWHDNSIHNHDSVELLRLSDSVISRKHHRPSYHSLELSVMKSQLVQAALRIPSILTSSVPVISASGGDDLISLMRTYSIPSALMETVIFHPSMGGLLQRNGRLTEGIWTLIHDKLMHFQLPMRNWIQFQLCFPVLHPWSSILRGLMSSIRTLFLKFAPSNHEMMIIDDLRTKHRNDDPSSNLWTSNISSSPHDFTMSEINRLISWSDLVVFFSLSSANDSVGSVIEAELQNIGPEVDETMAKPAEKDTPLPAFDLFVPGNRPGFKRRKSGEGETNKPELSIEDEEESKSVKEQRDWQLFVEKLNRERNRTESEKKRLQMEEETMQVQLNNKKEHDKKKLKLEEDLLQEKLKVEKEKTTQALEKLKASTELEKSILKEKLTLEQEKNKIALEKLKTIKKEDTESMDIESEESVRQTKAKAKEEQEIVSKSKADQEAEKLKLLQLKTEHERNKLDLELSLMKEKLKVEQEKTKKALDELKAETKKAPDDSMEEDDKESVPKTKAKDEQDKLSQLKADQEAEKLEQLKIKTRHERNRFQIEEDLLKEKLASEKKKNEIASEKLTSESTPKKKKDAMDVEEEEGKSTSEEWENPKVMVGGKEMPLSLEQLKRLSEIERYLFMIEETRKKKNELARKSHEPEDIEDVDEGEEEEEIWKSSIPDILAFSNVEVNLEEEKKS